MIYDVIVVGAGPAGLSAAVRAKKENLKVLVLEQGELANTVFNYQKKKHVMAEPAMIPFRCDVPFAAGPRETILQQFQATVQQSGIPINRPESVESIVKTDGIFNVTSNKGSYEATHVILAIGIQGNPNRLSKPGEDLPQVSYTLSDPSLYEDKDIMMVGAGDAAIEGVLALCDKNRVSVVNRNTEFFRLKDVLERQLSEKIRDRHVVAYHGATVVRFDPGHTYLRLPDRIAKVKTDLVFIRIGAALPRRFLEKCGVTFTSSDRGALPVIDEHYESSVPGLFVIGAVTGSALIKEGMNQGYEVVEHILGRPVEPVDEPLLKEKLKFLQGSVEERLATIAATIPLLTEVQKKPLRELILQANIHHLPADKTIFKEDDFSDSLYMILEGRVSMTVGGAIPGRLPVIMTRGYFFGEMSLLSGRRRSGTTTSAAPCILIEVPRKAVLRLMAAETSVKKHIDKSFIMRAFRSLLPGMKESLAMELAQKATIKSFKKGEVIFRQGDVGDAFYLIRSGSVKVTKTDGDEEMVVKYLPAGQYFGEMALLDERNPTRKANVIATTGTEVVQLMKDDFLAMLHRYPDYEQKLREEGQRMVLQNQAAQILYAGGTGMMNRMLQEGIFEGTDVLLIDENKCVRCDNCVKACEETHGGQTRLYRNEGILISNLLIPTSCRHCENPLCLTDCPPGDAIQRDPKGEVYIIETKCIGCGNCATNCPYGNILMLHPKPRETAFDRLLGLIGMAAKETPSEHSQAKAVKCDLCRDDSAGPACVRSCPTGAAIRVTPGEYFAKVEAVEAMEGKWR
jgi:thioredoxin reductase/CRP-like cAMP-binding protein